MLLSVVVPCYNEEEVIPITHNRLIFVLEEITPQFELIYIDDGSQDETPNHLRQLQQHDQRVKVVFLSRNFGHQMAITAGLDHVSGDAVVLIDADLQDPPEVIKEMVNRWYEGYDVVYGVRTDRQGETPFKLWSAKAFYRMMNRLSDVPIPLDTGDFRLMDRRVVEALKIMPERDRFLRGMVSWVGFRQVAVSYQRSPRIAGVSKYPLFKMIRFAADGILSFSLVPLRIAIWVGLLTVALSFLGILYALFVRLFTLSWVPGWTISFIAILFIGGIQLIFLGVIGEYIGRIYREDKRRPLYLVRESLGFEHLSNRDYIHNLNTMTYAKDNST
ncbi:glycosyltransferase family 2 protein [Crocosphaera watsonii WH 8501]|uniref:Glycosyltransferase n=2 Tax=Crocosphaera watsonii TaxID=263511 RepID=T2JMR8_CROWT|nr:MULTISPECIES: glycosyltransferase family 2 protein [Crocosphaera]MCH2245320.1 glycosyltransferase family 2 protein [Crocosphaera sp.]NQZ61792.1 glycosyltransferase family 2 protein [Crocosphaera sp.]CCQ56886.1 Glycosyltransferase [Crocosphaera watsonii WH 0005]CCQ65832.1 Glycosyltransferase [Crocosphaera watsonii WH 0402]